ncbi:MAG TPA: hypothetical protein DD434_00280, partial [Bacteroidales bacterium]|nr:hypothetical protein [Bacteroidales bacterium]
TYPSDTLYVKEAIRIRNQIAFEKVKQENTIEAYQNYVEQYPDAIQTYQAQQWLDIHSTRISQAKEETAYETAKQENTLQSYTQFIEQYPNSKYYKYAKDKIHQFQYNQNISTYSVEEIIQFLNLYPKHPKRPFLYDTLQAQTLRYLSIQGAEYLNKNQLYNIDINTFLLDFALKQSISAKVEDFNNLYHKFPSLKTNQTLTQKYKEAKHIEVLLSLKAIDNKTYNKNIEYFTTIKSDLSFQLLNKYLEPSIKTKKIAIINKALLPFEEDFRALQFKEMLFKQEPPAPQNSKTTISSDSTLQLTVDTKTNSYGKTDIYISTKENGQWSQEKILPQPINTPYREESPIINKDKDVLYFYSNRPMQNNSLDLYITFRGDTTSWNDWTEPLKTTEIDLKNINKKYHRGYLKDEQDNPVEALIYIEDSQTGERLFTTKSSISGQFAYPKQTKKANLISVIKGYVPKYNSDTNNITIKQDKIEDIYHKNRLVVIETLFPQDSPDKLNTVAENYLKYLAQSFQGSKYIMTISVHCQKGYKTMNEDDLSWHQATLIKNKLIALGINHQNIVTAGYGNKNKLLGWEDKNRIEIGFMLIGK